jgi:hypothetical protein
LYEFEFEFEFEPNRKAREEFEFEPNRKAREGQTRLVAPAGITQ